MKLARLFALVLLASLAVAVASASAAFPGKNGPIVYPFIHLNEGSDTGGLRIHGPKLKPRSTPLTHSADDAAPTFSPSGRLIAFEGNREAGEPPGLHIYVMRADGSGLRQLTSGSSYDEAPAFSPDGKEIVFSRTTLGPRVTHLFSIPLAGGAPTQLTTGAGKDTEPVFTPNGKRLLFVSDRRAGQKLDIFSASPNGNEVRLLVGGPRNDDQPDVSPDGKRIVFASTRDGGPELYLAGIDGRHQRAITHSRGGCFDSSCFAYPVFSPDGTHIAFQRRGRISSDIEVARADGSNVKEFEEASNGDEGFGTAVGEPAWGRALR